MVFPLRPWLPLPILVLSVGRALSQLGSGVTLFYAPIFFVNQVGIAPTYVGIALASASVSGMVVRVFGGMWADQPQWGRRRLLLLSALISALATGIFALTQNLPALILGNLLMGTGVGLYWPAAEAVIADLTDRNNRGEAFALNRLADNLGLGLGVLLGGWIIASLGYYRLLFVLDGLSFLVFFGVVYRVIPETLQPAPQDHPGGWIAWRQTLGDRRLWTFAGANILLTGYLAQIQSTLPLYLKNMVMGSGGPGLSTLTISWLLTGHIALASVLQLPLARWLKPFPLTRNLLLAFGLWGIAFGAIAWGGQQVPGQVAIISLGLVGVAVTIGIFTPAGSALVVELSPPGRQGMYLAVNSQCWAIGYLVGPALGGWVLDQPLPLIHGFWWLAGASVVVGMGLVYVLECQIRRS